MLLACHWLQVAAVEGQLVGLMVSVLAASAGRCMAGLHDQPLNTMSLTEPAEFRQQGAGCLINAFAWFQAIQTRPYRHQAPRLLGCLHHMLRLRHVVQGGCGAAALHVDAIQVAVPQGQQCLGVVGRGSKEVVHQGFGHQGLSQLQACSAVSVWHSGPGLLRDVQSLRAEQSCSGWKACIRLHALSSHHLQTLGAD